MKDRYTPSQPALKKRKLALEEKEAGRDLLSKQPADILKTIGDFFVGKEKDGNCKALAALTSTSQRPYILLQPAATAEVDKILFNHIVRGNPDAVYAMLDKQPSLLLHTFTVTDYAGYTITATPYRAALCCRDSQMAEQIQKRLIAYAGEEEAARQWDAQFPARWEEDEAERWNPIFTQLKKLDQVIRAAEEKDIIADDNDSLQVCKGSAVETELDTFQSLLDATRAQPIKTGHTFNLDFLRAIANCYGAYCRDFSLANPKLLLFWQRVFGYAQCLLSASDAQAFVDGLHKTADNLENNSPQGRSLKIEIWDPTSRDWIESSFFPLARNQLGVDYGIGAGAGRSRAWRQLDWLQNFYQSKVSAFQKLMPPRHLSTLRR